MQTFLKFLLSLGFCVIFVTVWGQCDTRIQPSDNTLTTYKIRGNRCEGFFRARVGAPALELVGFTQGIFKFHANEKEEIRVTVPMTFSEDINIRAVGIPVDLYYRMDASINENEQLAWPVKDVLIRDSRTSISRNIGILGYAYQKDRRIFFPVKTESRLAEPDSNQSKFLYFRSSNRLEKVLWKMSHETKYRIVQNKPVRAGKAFRIELVDIPQGQHLIQVVAKTPGAINYNISTEFYISN